MVKRKIILLLLVLMPITIITNYFFHKTLLFLTLTTFIASILILKMFDRWKIKENVKIILLLCVWLNIIGEIFMYDYLSYYDKIIHLIIPFFVVYILCEFYKQSDLNTTSLFLILAGLLLLWETYEWIIGKTFNVYLMGTMHDGIEIMTPLDDTIIDSILGLLGGSIYLIINKYKND